MNLLSTFLTRMSLLAADAPAAKAEDKGPPWIGPGGILEYWQIGLLFVMIGLIGFLFYYRKKQQADD